MSEEKRPDQTSRKAAGSREYDALRKKFGDYPTGAEGGASVRGEGTKEGRVDRSQKVERFRLNIEDDKVYEGPVYFSSHSAQSGDGASSGAQPGTRAGTAPARAGRKPEKMGAGLWGMLIAGILLATMLLSAYTISCVNDVLAMRKSEDTVDVEIPENAKTGQIIDILKEKDLIRHSIFCKVFYAVTNIGDKPPTYLNGTYTVSSDLGLEGMLFTFMVSPKPRETRTITIPEGFTIDQIAERLSQKGICRKDAFYKAVEQSDFSYWFLQDLPQDGQDRYRRLEGYLFPDTYEFYVDEQPNRVITRMLDNYQNKITTEYTEKAQAMNLSMDDVMKVASIIEREAHDKSQMNEIAAILYNRLSDRWKASYPNLGCDSTSLYVNRYVKANITDEKKAEELAQAYDTYLCIGLPRGPICNPGLAAINAALDPTKGSENLYFAHNMRTGKMYVSKTGAEHQKHLDNIKLGIE